MRRQGPSEDLLDALFSPRTVAIVGASADSSKWGHILAQRALASRGDRTVLLVNRHGGEVLGQQTYPSAQAAATALDLRVDLAVLCVPVGAMGGVAADLAADLPADRAAALADAALDWVDAGHLADRACRTLSPGELQRVALGA